MPVVYGALDLATNELRNVRVHNLPAAPPAGPTDFGMLWYDTTLNILKWWDGAQWIDAMGGAGAVPGDTVTTQTFGQVPVPGASTLFSRGDHAHGMPTHTAADHAAIPIDSLAPPTGPLDMGGQPIEGVGGPPVNDTDAANKVYVDGAVDGLTINTVPTTSLTAVQSGSTATGDLAWTITLDSLTLANTIPGTAPDPNTPLVPGEPGDVYIDTALGTTWIYDGTTWTQLDPAVAAGGITAITAGDGIAVDATTPAVPVVAAVIDPASDPSLTVGPAGINLTTGVAHRFAAPLAGTVSPEVVTHALGTTDIVLSVHNTATGSAVEVDWDATSPTTATVRFNPVLGAGYRVTVVG